MSEKFQADYPNSHYLSNLNNLNRTNQSVTLNRLPTLGEILSNKTKSPVDLYTFYLFMKEIENKVDYLDFWFDLINHLNLCKYYVKGLRDSILRQSSQFNDYSNRNSHLSQSQQQQQLQQPQYTSQNLTNSESNLRNSIPLSEKSKHKSLSSSILLDLIINDHVLEDNDSNRLSQFLRGDININNLDPKLKNIIDHYNREEEKSLAKTPNLNSSESPILQSPNLNSFKEDYNHSFDNNPFQQPKRISSHSKLLDDSSNNSSIIDNQLDFGEAKPTSFITSPKYVTLNNESSPQLPQQQQQIPPQQYQQQYQQEPSEQYQQPPSQQPTQSEFQQPVPRFNRHSINPSLLEKLIKESSLSENHSFITRNNLKESSHNLLLKYFVEDSEKNLDLPSDLNQFIIKSIEVDGRDDPDIFNSVKIYIFNKIENDHLPKFLNFMAIRNINKSINIRLLIGFISIFIAFWISYTLIFLKYYKGYRAVIVIPFLIGFYCLISSIYLIDPILCWCRLSESFVYNKSFIRIREKFIYKLLLKRSLWVLFLILLFTAIFTILFSLVPGHRL